MIFNRLFFVALMIGLTLGSACTSDPNDFDLTKNPLQGTIGGVEWSYQSGRAQFDASTNQMEALLFPEDILEPCGVKITNSSHLYIKFPARVANTTLGFQDSDFKFRLKNNAKEFTCYAGFINIVYFSGAQIIGDLRAEYDDDNVVAGSFSLQVCN